MLDSQGFQTMFQHEYLNVFRYSHEEGFFNLILEKEPTTKETPLPTQDPRGGVDSS